MVQSVADIVQNDNGVENNILLNIGILYYYFLWFQYIV